MTNTKFLLWPVLLASALCVSCSKIDGELQFPGEPPLGGLMPGETPPGGEAPGGTEDVPEIDQRLFEYAGEKADDAAKDIVGSDKDFYWEANTFGTKVTVRYEGDKASVECADEKIESHVEGAHVIIDMQSHSASGVEIELSGRSDDGSLKVYGDKKFKLTLNGVELNSTRGPAINSQCKKRIFVYVADGTTNKLTDAPTYKDDIWYIAGSTAKGEDRKGCFFSEGNLIFSGTGTLVVEGKQRHGIASDGYMVTRPGVTIAVTEAAKNAIHIKGDADDGIGIRMTGGLIYANVSADAGKGIKTDLHAEISGGKLCLSTSGNAIYDSDEKDNSSAAGIKADGNISISGGTVIIKSTGTGGKGLNADGSITFAGGETYIATTGGKYKYSSSLTSSPKGVKADGDITIEDGKLNISVTGASDSSEGLESKSALTINGGETCIYAYDDAINAETEITINGGKTYAYAANNDGIDSNGYLYLNGGLVIASGASGSEESFDCEVSSKFLVNGGTLIGTGGTYMTTPSSSSKQRVVLYSGISASKDEKITILNSSDKPIATFTMPRSMNGMALFFSSANIESGKSYTISKGGSISGYTDNWNGWYEGGTWSGGSSVGTFTSNNVITTVGSPNGPGGGNPPGGGWRP